MNDYNKQKQQFTYSQENSFSENTGITKMPQ